MFEKYFRAKFSEITFQSVQRALQSLIPPDRKQSDAVDVRSELDLRIGEFVYMHTYTNSYTCTHWMQARTGILLS